MPRALAIDIGRTCGWALADSRYLVGWKPRIAMQGPRPSNDGLTYGSWENKNCDHDALFERMFKKLSEIHAATPLSVVFYESSGANFKSLDAIWIHIGLAAVIRCWGRIKGVQTEMANNKSVKLHAARTGNADKGQVIAAAHKLGWKPADDHTADALFVLDLKLTEWNRPR